MTTHTGGATTPKIVSRKEGNRTIVRIGNQEMSLDDFRQAVLHVMCNTTLDGPHDPRRELFRDFSSMSEWNDGNGPRFVGIRPSVRSHCDAF